MRSWGLPRPRRRDPDPMRAPRPLLVLASGIFALLITEQQPALSGQDGLMWLLVGLAAAPAPLLWDRIARR
ncbi:hypothetical protein [Halochromatium glycolicum]|uniref:hypothetical protein n=1 Tax=Halochromatium glycolicum TaxID=85075 RepID=UPI001F5B7729|nr:hypothetical protein [Halochromatium glycolicum]